MHLEVREGPYCLSAEIVPMGEDFCVAVTGGKGHIGCACLGVAHPGITDPGLKAATVSTINAAGHRDGAAAERICKRLSAASGRTVAVVCGIHYDGLDARGIAAVTALAERLAEAVLEKTG